LFEYDSNEEITEEKAITIEAINSFFNKFQKSPLKLKSPKASYFKNKLSEGKKSLKDAFVKITKSPAISLDIESIMKLYIESLVQKYKVATEKNEKYIILTSIPLGLLTNAQIEKKFQCSNHMVKKALLLIDKFGPCSAPPPRIGKKISDELSDLIKNFYLDPINTRVLPGKYSTINIYDQVLKKSVPTAKQLILVTLNEFYAMFCKNFPNATLSVSKFCSMKPKQCVWSVMKGIHRQCCCSIHENFYLRLKACKNNEQVHEIMKRVFCTEEDKCAFSNCNNCPNWDEFKKIYSNDAYFNNNEISFYKWETTDRTAINLITESREEFEENIQNDFIKIAEHAFINSKQYEFFQNLKERTKFEPNSVICTVDYAQNYSFIVQDEAQVTYIHIYIFNFFI
jgi:hypothetical protein